jgi:transposase
MGSSTAAGFVARFAQTTLPKHLLEVLDPLIETIAELSARIAGLDGELIREARSDELLRRLQTVPGVGPLVSLAYVGWMDQPERFRKSRDVGACLGLRPRVRDSGGRQRRGHITREGDKEMRRLLVQAAHASLQCQRDSALKRWTESLAERVGKKKAVVATARKIAVLLHRLWVTGDRFQPFPVEAAA